MVSVQVPYLSVRYQPGNIPGQSCTEQLSVYATGNEHMFLKKNSQVVTNVLYQTEDIKISYQPIKD